MPIKVLGDDGSGDFADIAEGIRYAVDNGAIVINMSLGVDANENMRRDNGIMDKALQYAYTRGVTVVAAAGNEGVSAQVSYPSIYPTVISVGATDYRNAKAPYSNSGAGLDIVAPGGNTLVDANGDGYGDGILQETSLYGEVGFHFYQGTSMASPHVAAAAALLISAKVATTPDQIRSALTKSAKNLGLGDFHKTYGHGLLQVYDALNFDSSSGGDVASDKPAPYQCSRHKRGRGCKKRKECRWRRRKGRGKCANI